MKTVYLAGPITGQSYRGATGWRAEATAMLRDMGIAGVSPMRNKEFLVNASHIEGEYEQDVLSTARGIITRDRYDCLNSDAVLFNLRGAERVSTGTMIEIGWTDGARIPSVGIMEEGGVHTHPMVSEAIDFWCRDMEEAIHALASLLLPHDRLPQVSQPVDYNWRPGALV